MDRQEDKSFPSHALKESDVNLSKSVSEDCSQSEQITSATPVLTKQRRHDPFMEELLKNQRKNQNLLENKTALKPKITTREKQSLNNKQANINQDTRTLTNSNSYSYASFEFRPMKITDDGMMSTPVNDKPPNKSLHLYDYAQVNGRKIAIDEDKPNPGPLSDKLRDSANVQHTAVNGDLYAVVDKSLKQTKTNDITETKSLPESSTDLLKNGVSNQVYDMVGTTDSNKNNNNNISDLYATVDKPVKRKTEQLLQKFDEINFNEIRQKGGGGRRSTDGLLDTSFFRETNQVRLPPRLPKPYAQSRHVELPTHKEEPPITMRQRLNSFNRNSISTEDMLGTYTDLTQKYDTPSQMTESKNFQNANLITVSTKNASDERLAKSQNSSALKEMKNFQKRHRRMKSHEFVARTFSSEINNTKDISSPTNRLKSHESFSSLSTSKSIEDDVLSDSSHSVDMTDIIRKAQELGVDELPAGWEEVKDGAETYYWHLWTGTIQYERPVHSRTASSCSRSISPFSGPESTPSSRAASVSEYTDDTKVNMPSSESSQQEKPKQVISFPVHSMGWMDVEENKMSPKIIGETVNACITDLAEKRKDLWDTAETWAGGADIKLVLEGEILKLVELKTKKILHTQPIAKMRVWGVGRVETRDFAYIARDQSSGKHRCHMFRCHGHVSGRSITNALQAICTRVLDEKRRAKEKGEGSLVKSSDLLRPPSKIGGVFNEKPLNEQKKRFTAKYVGLTEVSKPSGIDIINKAVAKLTESQQSSDWASVLIEVTTSEIKTVDCIKQQTIMEHRVRYVSFLAVAQDERFGAYIVAVAEDTFICHVYFCAPHAGILTKAIEEACKLRYEKVRDARMHSSTATDGAASNQTQQQQQEASATQQQNENSRRESMKEKTKFITSSVAGLFTKLNKKDNKKKDEEVQKITLKHNEHLVKYYGSVEVDIGTGVETVQKAASSLAGGEMMLGYLEVQSDVITLTDSQRTALSKRIYDVNTISHCGMTSDRKYFGIIISCGKGKYMCHVFQEYRMSIGSMAVNAIQDVL